MPCTPAPTPPRTWSTGLRTDCVLTVKRNQKRLFDQVEPLPWASGPRAGHHP
ncbi:hypothetical protein [Nocardiopsis ansamitocini]|uniref:hypothetical protein n=1 Tax=Nocardiopsis ansamitocini TaxID=1670832 RepID=UPI0025556DEE|nr:hypothetical protein [Nocardiopsis ansamitocini]